LIVRGHALINRELLANPSVEQEGSPGWPAEWFHSATNTDWANTARRGGHSLHIQVVGQTADWRSKHFMVKAGKIYRLMGYFRGTGSTQTFLTIRWFSNSDGTGFISEDNITLDNIYLDWTQSAQNFTAPPGAQSADIMFRCPTATVADIYGDDFSVRRVQ